MPSEPNPALAALRDIHAGADVPWWPPAPGWWVLAVLVLAGVIWAAIRIVRYLRRLALRRRVLRQIDACGAGRNGDLRGFASRLNIILKRVALRRFGRERISALHGGAWAQFLASTGKQAGSESAWNALAAAPYAPRPDFDADASIALAKNWVRQHV